VKKEYRSLVINGYTVQEHLDKKLKEYTDDGWQLTVYTIRGDILIFERDEND